MGVIVGVVVGYALGTRAGEEGWTEFVEACKMISTSEEMRDLLAGGLTMTRSLLLRGNELLAETMGGGTVERALRPVA